MHEKSGKDAEKNDNIDRVIEIISNLAGSAFGSVTGEPTSGALIGTASGKGLEIALRRIKEVVLSRLLSSGEKVRVLNTFEVALEEIQRRIEDGESCRKDGFFDERQTERSDAVEVAESVLLKAQREPEEKKILYMGYLLASIAFDPRISAHMAHQLTKAAEQLTYRQLCILKLCAVKDKFGLRDTSYRERSIESIENDLYEVLYDCADLHVKEYIHSGLDTITYEENVLSRLMSILPSNMAFHKTGCYLYNLMKLSQIPDEDIAPIAEQLQAGGVKDET